MLVQIKQESGYESESDSQDEDSFVYKIREIQSDLRRYESDLGVNRSKYFDEFDKRFKVFNDRLDESLKIILVKDLFTTNEVEKIENDILKWSRTCSNMMKDNDSRFYEIQGNWAKLNERLKQITSIESILTRYGMTKRKVAVSSVYIFLEASSVQHLDSFWKVYLAGKLEEEIRQSLLEVRTEEHVDASLTVEISDQNYSCYRMYLGRF